MGYCMYVLAASDRVVPAGELRALLDDCQTGVTLTCTCGTEDDWVQLDLEHRKSPTDDPDEIGVRLTEGMMMEPEASVSALVFHHPDAAYFSVGSLQE